MKRQILLLNTLVWREYLTMNIFTIQKWYLGKKTSGLALCEKLSHEGSGEETILLTVLRYVIIDAIQQ